MPKALVFSDLHIHKHKKSVDRLDHCLETLEWVFATASLNSCEYIFFLGDLFHDRSNIDVMVMYKTSEIFQRYFLNDPPFNLYLLVGNHDMYHREKWDIHSVKPFGAMPNVHVIDSPRSINIAGLDIDFLPHMENPIKEINNLKKNNHPLLLAHLAVDGAFYNPLYGTKSDVVVETDNEMVRVTPDLFDSWQMTLLGHYHNAQHLNDKVEYLGSPLELTFGEAFQEKHVMILDLKTLDKEYIANDFSPKHVIVNVDKADQFDFNNKFVRITHDGDTSATEIIDFKNQVRSKYNLLSLDFVPRDDVKDKQSEIVEDARSIMFKEDDMLLKWIERAGVPDGLDKDILLNYGKMICEDKVKDEE
jgi:DNA repair exonuclease SbcCD nuclease subunit